MKIAIIGSQGTGKTTLVNDLSKAIGYKVLLEVARQMIKEGFKLDLDITEETEYELLRRQKKLEKTEGPWIADRCLIDLLAYAIILFKKNTELIKAIREELEKAEYDLVIYLKPEFPIKKDGIRSTDKNFQKEIDKRIGIVLKDLSIRWCRVRGSKERRLQQVLRILQNVSSKT